MNDLETAIARALVRSRGAGLTADDGNWPQEVAHYRELAAKHGDLYTGARSLITDAFRDARACLAEIEQQGCAIVPVEPTTEMGLAGIDARDWSIAQIWAAMLAAAPKVTP